MRSASAAATMAAGASGCAGCCIAAAASGCTTARRARSVRRRVLRGGGSSFSCGWREAKRCQRVGACGFCKSAGATGRRRRCDRPAAQRAGCWAAPRRCRCRRRCLRAAAAGARAAAAAPKGAPPPPPLRCRPCSSAAQHPAERCAACRLRSSSAGSPAHARKRHVNPGFSYGCGGSSSGHEYPATFPRRRPPDAVALACRRATPPSCAKCAAAEARGRARARRRPDVP